MRSMRSEAAANEALASRVQVRQQHQAWMNPAPKRAKRLTWWQKAVKMLTKR